MLKRTVTHLHLSHGRAKLLDKKLNDARGNRDGIVGGDNERHPAGYATKSVWLQNPLARRVTASLDLRTRYNGYHPEMRLSAAFADFERVRGPVTTMSKPAHVTQEAWDAFRADKAISLIRFQRDNHEVTEAMVTAKGSVNGVDIEPREIFTQRIAPVGTPSKTMVVISPGFGQTGRNFHEQAQLLSKQGHDVVLMDHQWAGLSSGMKGGIDRGNGVARDVAAVTAKANEWARASYGDQGKVVVLGTSMGGGPGAFGAALLNNSGKISLDGPAMPKDVDLVLQGPYFSPKKNAVNTLMSAMGHVPGLNQLKVPALGLPKLSSDPATLQKFAVHTVTEDISMRAQATNAAHPDLAAMKALLEQGVRPEGRVFVLHSNKDPLADYDVTREWTALLGDRGHLRTVDSNSHIFEENPAEQHLMLEGFDWLRQA